jgi:Ca-activated chloride channel family protein
MAEDVVTTGFTLAWPWLLALAPLPWLLRWLLPEAGGGAVQALRVPWYEAVAGRQSNNLRRPLLMVLASVAWLLLVGAAARPQWVGEVQSLPITGRDLLLAVDISGSMDTQDMVLERRTVNRLAVVKQVAGDFVERRRGDRVGLILFGSRAYLQTPLTFDTETTATLLDEAEIGLAGRETAIGDAIGLAVKRLRDDAAAERVLVLLTDGANTSGEVQPLQAAEFAAREGLTIYTVGVGADELMVQDFFGSRVVNPSADLDEGTLRAIAERTGGQYFRARDTQSLVDIYRRLDELEPVESDAETIRPVDELFHWPLAAAWLLLLAGVALTLAPTSRRLAVAA